MEEDEPKEPEEPEGEITEDDNSEQPNDDDDIIVEPNASVLLYNYLQSEKGHDIAKQILEIVKGVKQSTLGRNVEQDKVNAEQAKMQTQLLHEHYGRILNTQRLVFALTILATSFLTYFGKFESPVAVLFGTLVGYFFGRRTSSKDS
jgi:hypothetical protein